MSVDRPIRLGGIFHRHSPLFEYKVRSQFHVLSYSPVRSWRLSIAGGDRRVRLSASLLFVPHFYEPLLVQVEAASGIHGGNLSVSPLGGYLSAPLGIWALQALVIRGGASEIYPFLTPMVIQVVLGRAGWYGNHTFLGTNGVPVVTGGARWFLWKLTNRLLRRGLTEDPSACLPTTGPWTTKVHLLVHPAHFAVWALVQ